MLNEAVPNHQDAPVRPEPASLDNPLYYLENGLTVVTWVREHHADLLTGTELARISGLLALPRPSQALLLRLVMRTGNYFRANGLDYPEMGKPVAEALSPLVRDHWVEPDPLLPLATVAKLLRRSELATAFAGELDAAGLGARASKAAMEEFLLDRHREKEQPLGVWWPACPDAVLALKDMPLFDRIRLMFFGNLRQDWSEFVVTVLGYQSYERVAFSNCSRAFQSRQEVDHYLNLHTCRERLRNGEAPLSVWASLPTDIEANPWLSHRRARLLFELGQIGERSGDQTLALDAYQAAGTPDARVRCFRMLEKSLPAVELWPRLQAARDAAATATEALCLARICRRVGKKAGAGNLSVPFSASVSVRSLSLVPEPDQCVEQQVAAALSDSDCCCFYVENTLFNGLFGLLFWPAIFAPLPGAFFHPFQSGPADLYREDFADRRQVLVDSAFAALETGEYRQRIRQCWRDCQGTTNPFVHWAVLDEALLNLALDCIPATDLQLIFRRLLQDLRAHRSGLPDLARFWPQGHRYELIEVKAPGDRLQDHQRLWLEFFEQNDIAAHVCAVSWEEIL